MLGFHVIQSEILYSSGHSKCCIIFKLGHLTFNRHVGLILHSKWYVILKLDCLPFKDTHLVVTSLQVTCSSHIGLSTFQRDTFSCHLVQSDILFEVSCHLIQSDVPYSNWVIYLSIHTLGCHLSLSDISSSSWIVHF